MRRVSPLQRNRSERCRSRGRVDEQDVVRMVRAVVDAFGDYDVLINNAGFGTFAPLVETTLEDMQRVYATNVFGAMLVARESARHFVSRNRGNIVNVASTAGQRGFAGGTAYSSSKFALAGLTECWRAELRKHNIRVMQINPSEVQTEFVAASGRPLRARSANASSSPPTSRRRSCRCWRWTTAGS